MDFLIFCVQFAALVLLGCRGQNTMRDIINARPELSRIRAMLQGTDTIEKLGSSASRLTFFAPHNDAFGNLTEQLRSQLNTMTKTSANQICLYHTVNTVFLTTSVSSSGMMVRLQTLANNGPMYMFFYHGDMDYINGAQVLEKDIAATNGMLHIISSIFVTTGPALNSYKGNLDSYINDNTQATSEDQKTSIFNSLLDQYDLYMSKGMALRGPYGHLVDNVLKNSSAFAAAFIPTDSAIRRFENQNPNGYRDLKTGPASLLQQVMESHVIPNGAFHSNLLVLLSTNSTIAAMQGRIRMYTIGGVVYVSNNCGAATVTKANTTMDNGVAYFIDNIIGYIVNDLYQQINTDNGIPDFRGTLQTAPWDFQALFQLPAGVNDVPEDKKYTIFAPNTDAFYGNDFNQDPGQRLTELKMTILPGTLAAYQMVNGTQRSTLADGFVAKFYQYPDGVYVDVDYVRAKIVQADICTKNGVIHKVDKILGVPARNIYEEIAIDTQMTFLETVLINTGLKSLLQDNSRQMTMFAPIDNAFSQMTKDSPSYLNRQNESKLKNIMLRHVGRGVLFLDRIVPINGETTINTYNGEIRLGNQNNGYYILIGSVRINIIRANMRMKNGVFHVIDKVLYDPNDPRTGESTSKGSVPAPYSYIFSKFILISLGTLII